MKSLTILLLIISGTTYSQKIKDKLQGDWVCTKIVDSNGNPASGKFGESNEYLKFSFVKGNLSISEAPFDRGIKMPIKYDTDYIDLFPQAVYEFPERKYTLKSFEESKLILSTKNENGEAIDYHFINQDKLAKELSASEQIFDNGLIIIKHLKLSKETKGANRVFEYKISNDARSLYPNAIFNDNASSSFGYYFSLNFVFPKAYPIETVSDELIIDFDLDDKGVSNIRIVQGLSDEIDASVTKIFEKTSKKWEPLKMNGQTIKTTLRFHFVFYLAVAEPEIRFAN